MRKKGGDISNFIAVKSIENGVVTYANGRLARVIKVNSLNLALLDGEEQKIKINQFHFIDNTCCPFFKYLIAIFINKQIIIGITAA